MPSRNPSSFTIPAQLVPLLSQGQALRKQGAGIQCICGWIPAPLLSQGQALLNSIQSLPLYAVEQGGKLLQEWACAIFCCIPGLVNSPVNQVAEYLSVSEFTVFK